MQYINSRSIAVGDTFRLKSQMLNGLVVPAGLYEITKINFNAEMSRIVQLTKADGGASYRVNWDKQKIIGSRPKLEKDRLYQSNLKPQIHFRIKSIGNKEIHGIVYTSDKRVEGCCLPINDFCKHYKV